MLREPEDKQLPHSPDGDDLYDLNTVASSMECTGLIPTPPVSESEAESYTDLYNIPQPHTEAENHGRLRGEEFCIGMGTARKPEDDPSNPENPENSSPFPH